MIDRRYVYVVTEGEYSDYGISAVFESREEADAFAGRYAEVEVWPLGDKCNRGDDRKPYSVTITERDGAVVETDAVPGAWESRMDEDRMSLVFRGNQRRFWCDVMARDAKHAAKIASERRVAFIAKREAIAP